MRTKKINVMAKIILNYDAKNIVAKKLLEGILATDLFKVEDLEKNTPNHTTIEAMKEVEAGNTIKYKSIADFKKRVLCTK